MKLKKELLEAKEEIMALQKAAKARRDRKKAQFFNKVLEIYRKNGM